MPSWVPSPLREQAYFTDPEYLKGLGIELRSPIPVALDVTLPGRPIMRGRLHPATLILREIYDIWAAMGFQVYRSPEVETDVNNFELLNMPPHHPARDMWDTFYLDEKTRLVSEIEVKTTVSPEIRDIAFLRADFEKLPAPGGPPGLRVPARIFLNMEYRSRRVTLDMTTTDWRSWP